MAKMISAKSDGFRRERRARRGPHAARQCTRRSCCNRENQRRPAIIAGWAYGNRVARMLAIDRPELVRGVVLIAAGGKFPPKPEVMTELRAFHDKSLSLEKHCSTRRQCLVTDSGNS